MLEFLFSAEANVVTNLSVNKLIANRCSEIQHVVAKRQLGATVVQLTLLMFVDNSTAQRQRSANRGNFILFWGKKLWGCFELRN